MARFANNWLRMGQKFLTSASVTFFSKRELTTSCHLNVILSLLGSWGRCLLVVQGVTSLMMSRTATPTRYHPRMRRVLLHGLRKMAMRKIIESRILWIHRTRKIQTMKLVTSNRTSQTLLLLPRLKRDKRSQGSVKGKGKGN